MRKNSPSPTPTTIGLLCRAATIRSWLPFSIDGDGVGADHLPEGLPHGFGQRAAAGRPDVFDQIHQHLGVGAAAEGVSVLFEGVLQHAVVLDDAVVYQGYVLRFGVVGMGVGVVRNPVRGPAGVARCRYCRRGPFPSRKCSRSETLPLHLNTLRRPSGLTSATPALSYPLYSRR